MGEVVVPCDWGFPAFVLFVPLRLVTLVAANKVEVVTCVGQANKERLTRLPLENHGRIGFLPNIPKLSVLYLHRGDSTALV